MQNLCCYFSRIVCTILIIGIFNQFFSVICLSQNNASIINNRLEPKYKKIEILKLSLELEIKNGEGEYSLLKPRKILLDNKNNIYIVDSKENVIIKFDCYGHYLLSIGKPGIGPGELSEISGICIRDNILIVGCGNRSYLQFFSLDGKYLKSSPANIRLADLDCDADGNIFSIRWPIDGEWALIKLDEKFGVKKIIEKRKWEEPHYFGGSLSYAFGKDNKIVVGNPENYSDYKINVYKPDGEIDVIIRKEHRPIRIPEEETEKIKKRNPLNWEIPKYYLPYSIVYTNENGLVIVNTYSLIVRNKEMVFDIFDVLGNYISRTTLKFFSYYNLWRNGRLYTIQENDDGDPIIKIYKLFWKY